MTRGAARSDTRRACAPSNARCTAPWARQAHHSLPRHRRRPRRQGRQLRQPARRRRSGRGRRAATTSRAPTSSRSSTSRASVETRGLLYDMIEAVADQVFIPLTVGGGVQHGRRRARAAQRRRRQGQHQHRRRRATRAHRRGVGAATARSASSSAIDAKQVRGRTQWQVYTHGGRTPTGHRRRRVGAAKWRRCGAGEILLTSMDRDGARKRLRPAR